MKDKLVSVILPLYNRASYIKEALESIIGQTYKNLEIIVIDDCSTDDGLKIVGNYTDSRIKILKNEKNMGIAYTRNKGFEISKGKYIALLDSDDIALPNRIKKQVDFLEKNNDIYLVGGNREDFDSGGVKGKSSHAVTPEELKIALLFDMAFTNPTIMMRREVVEEFRQDNNFKVAQDYDFIYRVSQKYKTSNLTDILIRYRLHENQISRRIDYDLYLNEIKGRLLKEFGISKELHKSYFNGINYEAEEKEVLEFAKVIIEILEKNMRYKRYSSEILEKKLLDRLARCIRRNLKGLDGIIIQKKISKEIKKLEVNIPNYFLRIIINSVFKKR